MTGWGLPQLNPDDALQAIRTLVTLDQRWVPTAPGTSLYIRPFLFSNDPKLGLHGVHDAMFVIILSPVGSYFASGLKPVKIMVETEDVRAVRGGTGEAKCGGNYGAANRAGERATAKGFSQVLWMDAIHPKYVEEGGGMNVMFKLGGKVVTLSGPDGYVYDPDGVCTQEKFDFMLSMRAGGADKVEPYADRFGVEFFPGKRPWEVPVDIVIPCATQNELDVEDAVMIVANNVRYYVEAANMPATAEALRLLRLSPKILTAGSKASGSGGVVVSALEMVQNSLRYSWTRQEVDSRLKQIMGGIYDASAAAAEEYGLGYDLIAGNDIAAFKKISTAMIAQGL